MFITDLKINGITNPMGFSTNHVYCSWKVEDTIARKQKNVLIEVSLSEDFSSIVFEKKGQNLSSLSTEIQFPMLPRTRYYWRVNIKGDKKESATSKTAWFETGKMNEPWQANWIACQEEVSYQPEFTTKFDLDQNIISARLYITGLGLYQAFINGERCGNEYLTPCLTDYFTGVEYQTYDVTSSLKEENVISIHMGKGWYMSSIGKDRQNCLYGSEMCALAELHMIFEDGTEGILSTDETWSYTKSFIQETDFIQGEEYNKNIKKAAKGKKVCLVESPFPVKDRTSLPITEQETLSASKIIKAEKNSYILDFSHTITGFITFKDSEKSGTKITFEYGNPTSQGKFESLTKDKGTSRFSYTSNGKEETVHPLFTCYTFSQVKVTGLTKEPSKKDIQAVALQAEMEPTGTITTSSKEINNLYESAVQKLRNESLVLPSISFDGKKHAADTRNAWIQCTHSNYTLDSKKFFDTYIEFISTEQSRLKGAVPSSIPSLTDVQEISSGWGDAITLLPPLLHSTYGDTERLKLIYPFMKAWTEHLKLNDDGTGKSHFLILEKQTGDTWAKDGLTPECLKGSTEDKFIGTVFYYESVLITASTAQKLGHELNAIKFYKLALGIRQRIFHEWFTPSGRLASDTQTSYILCLKFQLWKNKDILLQQFKNRLARDMYNLKCGIIGLPYALEVLSENGMANIAYQQLFMENSPVWTVTPHSAATFLYKTAGGITSLEPGFKKAQIAPCITMKFREFEETFNSPSGKYEIKWSIRDDGMILVHLEIPFNTSAKVILPECNGYNIDKIKGPNHIKFDKNGMALLKSGSYDILYKPSQDFRYIYSPATRLGELVNDKEAMKLLQKSLPEIYDSILKNDAETLNKSLGEIQSLLKPENDPTDANVTVSQIQSLIRW